jgi:hypothetical protein
MLLRKATLPQRDTEVNFAANSVFAKKGDSTKEYDFAWDGNFAPEGDFATKGDLAEASLPRKATLPQSAIGLRIFHHWTPVSVRIDEQRISCHGTPLH